jgi:hypothetical protein
LGKQPLNSRFCKAESLKNRKSLPQNRARSAQSISFGTGSIYPWFINLTELVWQVMLYSGEEAEACLFVQVLIV